MPDIVETVQHLPKINNVSSLLDNFCQILCDFMPKISQNRPIFFGFFGFFGFRKKPKTEKISETEKTEKKFSVGNSSYVALQKGGH